MSNLEKARNPNASNEVLSKIIKDFKGERDLAEALILNAKLSSSNLSDLLKKCSPDLALLALGHPNLSTEDQISIILSMNNETTRTLAKLLILKRKNLSKETLSILCLDPHKEVRETAQRRMVKDDPNDSDS